MKHIGISAACIAALILSSCSLLPHRQHQASDSQPPQGSEGQPGAKKKGGQNGDSELGGAVPSDEQQRAARLLLVEQGDDAAPTVSTTEDIPAPGAVSSVPGGRGLRMGNLAPPEEAASSGGAPAPKPNRVERRGLRSPSLPKGLPMDINGKITPNN